MLTLQGSEKVDWDTWWNYLSVPDRKLLSIQEAGIFEFLAATKAFVYLLASVSYLVPAFQGPFPLLQHKPLVLIRPLDVALTNFQPLDDFPAVCLLAKNKRKKIVLCQTKPSGENRRYICCNKNENILLSRSVWQEVQQEYAYFILFPCRTHLKKYDSIQIPAALSAFPLH